MAAGGNASSDDGNWLHMGHCSKQGEGPVWYPPRAHTASPLKNLRVLNLAGCIQAGKQLFGLARLIASGCEFSNVDCLNLADIGTMTSISMHVLRDLYALYTLETYMQRYSHAVSIVSGEFESRQF
jgi:hypothetical protein